MLARSAACVLILVAIAMPAAAQQVHRWVDAQGQVHYGDRPLGAEVTRLRIRAESATAPSGDVPVAAATTAPGRAAGRPVSRAADAPAVPAVAPGAMHARVAALTSRASAPPPRAAASATPPARDAVAQRIAANVPGTR